jgi:hypothetical protein
MSSTAVWEGLLLATMAIALGFIHAWKDRWATQRRADAEEASRLHEVRQEAVNQLKLSSAYGRLALRVATQLMASSAGALPLPG